jgi:enamine deaminase RidA (YjgF/YER057c/UK114 family)
LSRHDLFDPDGMPPARGFSYGALAAEGRVLHLAGMTGHHADGTIDEGLVEQFAGACAAVERVVSEAGGTASDVVSMIIYTSEIASYRENLQQLGEAYRSVFGRHYPPMALLGVSELFDPAAQVELVCVAVVPF